MSATTSVAHADDIPVDRIIVRPSVADQKASVITSVLAFIAALAVGLSLTTGAQAAVTETFPTGASNFVVPSGVTSAQVHAVGGQGSRGYFNSSFGGRAAVIDGTLAMTPGDTLYLYTAGNGHQCGFNDNGAGYNGGGLSNPASKCVFSGGGGGASDIRTTSGDLSTRVLAAAGGGGAGDYGNGGDAGARGGNGGDAGAPGNGGESCAPDAQPGTTSTGGAAGGGNCGNNPVAGTAGSLGQGGIPGYRTDNVGNMENSGGGGGGGWYGGGGGSVYGGGAGGSSHTTAAVSGAQTGLAALGSTPVITLTFSGLMLNIETAGTGSGFVDSAPVPSSSPVALDCGRDTPGVHTSCAKEYRPGATVTLTAHPETATTDFAGFSGGGCSGTSPCEVSMDQVRNVTATFTLKQRTIQLTTSGTGAGYVDSSPAGIDCGRNVSGHADCNASYAHGTLVTLTAQPETTTTDFTGFSGAGCSGTSPCEVTMDQVRNVTATFTLIPPPIFAVNPASADFGEVPLGQISEARTFTVMNTSTGVMAEPLVFDSAVVNGTGFKLTADDCSGETVAPGDTCTLDATFSPVQAGAATGTVTLPSNVAGSPATIALSATGTAVVAPPPPTLRVTRLSATRCLGTVTGAHRRVKIGFTLSTSARVKLTLQRRVGPGKGIRHRCPKALPAAAPGHFVTVDRPAGRPTGASVARAKTQPLSRTMSVAAGPHKFALKTLFGAARLVPGRYRVLIQAVSATGVKVQKAGYFWVLKPQN